MATIADELNAISVEHGYTGAAPKTIAGAIDALADTLAGTDVEGRRTIAGAVKALAPYIGTGGGTTLGALVEVGASPSGEFHVSTAPYDISGETSRDVGISIDSTTNVCMAYTTDEILAPNGCYVAINNAVPVDWSTDSLGVYIGEEPVTSGFECRVLPDGVNHSAAFFTMQIPETDNGLYINLGIE